MTYANQAALKTTLDEIQASGLYKNERVITSPQGASIRVNGKEVLNFCANNYLGLSSHPEVVAAAHRDRVNAKAMKAMEKAKMPKKMPFDVKRETFGGFKTFAGK